ncbi:MAG: pseudouridine synthase [Phycisphaerae bacterium]|jgi:23S rRNA pseudouridine2605 synthase|nr:pseudouridine synthase [Phycisphaerae bacterium]
MSKVRIQKLLSELGVASRRAIEQMVMEGRIAVNGHTVATLPCFVDADVDEIRADGRRVRTPAGGRNGRIENIERVYFLLNKPQGVVCTQHDPAGRPRAVDLVPAGGRRVYCVGRLDVQTTGLILLTNDGRLTQQLTHPRYGVVKTYVAQVEGRLDEKNIARLKRPTHLDGRRTAGAQVKVLRKSPDRSLLEIKLREGRNREIRRTLARLGHKVRRLKRVAIGPVTDRGLKIGNSRRLRKGEVTSLRRAAARANRSDSN